MRMEEAAADDQEVKARRKRRRKMMMMLDRRMHVLLFNREQKEMSEKERLKRVNVCLPLRLQCL